MHPQRDFSIWNGVVEYSHAVMETVRAEAVEGFNSFGHGGLETGGVLYGERRGEIVRVLASVKLEFEHELGPGFALSDTDAAKFRELMKPRDGMRAVGWYCSHTRTGVALNTNDCSIMERFFSERGSVALLVKPSRFGPVEATFYVQGSAEPGPHFSVLPPRAEPPQPVAAASVAPEPLPVAAAAMAPVWVARDMPWLRWVGLGVALAASAASFISMRPAGRVKSASTRMGLQAYSIVNRQVRIEWDRQAAAVRAAKAGTLEIVDGASRYSLPLNVEQLRTSSLTFGRQTDSVQVRMKLADGPEETVQVVALLSPQRPKPIAVPVPESAPAPAETPVETPADEISVQPDPAPPPPVAARAPLKRFQLTERERRPAGQGSVALPDPPAAAPATSVAALWKPPLTIPGAALTSPAPAPRSGRMIWTGSLNRRGVVEIEGGLPTVGSLSGGLPGLPAKLSVLPAEFTRDALIVFLTDASRHNRTEPAGPLTGWNRLHYVWDPERVKQISVLEAPNANNQYARLALRNEGKPCSVIVVEWRVE